MIVFLPIVALVAITADPSGQAVPDAHDKVFYPSDTEHALPLGRKLAGNILLDQKDIWTSPFRISRSNARWWIGFAGVTAALIATDNHTIQTFENSPGQVRWGNRVSNIGASYTVAGVAGMFYLTGVVANSPKARETGFLSGEAMIDSLVVVEVLKLAAERARPDAGLHAGHFFHGGSSFPSGHAIASWALASVVADEYHGSKLVPVAAYGLAGVVSAARFTAQKHYLSDILAGSAMGWFIGHHVTKTHNEHSSHPHAELRLLPNVEPSRGTYGFTLAIREPAAERH